MSNTDRIIARAAREITPGSIVNLGIGLPAQVVNYLPDNLEVLIHAENGILGVGPQPAVDDIDPQMIDSAGNYVTTLAGGSHFDSAVSFAMIRRGKLDLTMIGAFEVDQHGNLANWKIPGKFSPGIGGAMELAQKTPRIVVLSTHCDKYGNSKILKECRLPLTAERCVSRIITDKAVMDVTPEGLLLVEKASDVTLDELIAMTEAPLILSEHIAEF
ncbi:3-oxoacid CoA-transferase subunit B [Paenalcaligenes sp. Me131]|uniref:3-oxoacid CoA-transferase subunit B n=1 Tax=Paenalcaligenes sp. Me131 TaxID=3392636 RepID=UPI003D2D26D0